MTHNKIVISTLPLFLALAGVLLILPGKGQIKNPVVKSQRRAFDENRYPMADFLAAEPSDAIERVNGALEPKNMTSPFFTLIPMRRGTPLRLRTS